MQLKDCVIIGGQGMCTRRPHDIYFRFAAVLTDRDRSLPSLSLCLMPPSPSPDMLLEARELSNRPHVIIATPGRLAHHIQSHTVSVTLSPSAPAAQPSEDGGQPPLTIGGGGGGGGALHFAHVKYLVLDEADRLLIDPSFKDPLNTILSVLPGPEARQTLLFSATLPPNMSELVGTVTKPQIVTCQVSTDENAFVETLDQRYLFIPEQVKEVYLAYILTETAEFKATATEPGKTGSAGTGTGSSNSSCIIFTRTKERCEKIAEFLTEMGVPSVESLHSNKNQARRNASLGKFRSGQSKILVATDVAARGLDIPTVRLVINFDVPAVIADYVHRVGRTARAGRAGIAITLCSASDVSIFTQIEEFTGKRMTEYALPEQKVLTLIKKVFTTKVVTEIRIDEYRKKMNKNRYSTAASAAAKNNKFSAGDENESGGSDTSSAAAAAPSDAAKPKRKHTPPAPSAGGGGGASSKPKPKSQQPATKKHKS